MEEPRLLCVLQAAFLQVFRFLDRVELRRPSMSMAQFRLGWLKRSPGIVGGLARGRPVNRPGDSVIHDRLSQPRARSMIPAEGWNGRADKIVRPGDSGNMRIEALAAAPAHDLLDDHGHFSSAVECFVARICFLASLKKVEA